MQKLSETKQLTPKQALFVEEFLIDLNATQSAVRAGYSKKIARTQGPENLSKPAIQQAIQKAMAGRSERTEITQDYVLQGVKETIERCRQIAPVLDKSGNQVMVDNIQGEAVHAFTFQPNPALKGYELLGKHLGMFKENEPSGGFSALLQFNVHFVAPDKQPKTLTIKPTPALDYSKDDPDKT